MKRINVYIPEEMFDELKGRRGRLSDHVRYALEDYVEKTRVIKASASASKRKEGDLDE